MPQSIKEKKERFSRMFPNRVQTLIKTLQLLANCTNKSNYAWDDDLVKRAWIEIALELSDTCAQYDMDLNIELDGKNVALYDTSLPLEN